MVASLVYGVSSKSVRQTYMVKPYLKKKVETSWGRHLTLTSDLHIHTHEHKYTYMHIYIPPNIYLINLIDLFRKKNLTHENNFKSIC